MSEVRRFIEYWVECFNRRDFNGLDKLCHDSCPETSRVASIKYNKNLFEAGYRAVDWTVTRWKQPNWSIFNTQRFEPPPTHMANVILKTPDGFTNKVFVAFAQHNGTIRSCYYVKIQKRSKNTKLDLPAHSGRVKRFVKNAINKLSKQRRSEPITQVLLSFSVEQGILYMSFDTRADYEHGDCEKMRYYNIHSLLLPKLARFFESGLVVIGTDGRVFTLHRPAIDEGNPTPLAEIVGQWLVALILELIEMGTFVRLGPIAAFGCCVEEIDGKFGWIQSE